MPQFERIQKLTGQSPEEKIASTIDFVKEQPEYKMSLLQYLPLQHPLYEGRSANEVIRIRGYMFESFGHTGLPEPALPFVLEVLETERNAYMVASAAIALRGLPDPLPQTTAFLLKAIENIKTNDDAVSFEHYKLSWPLPNYTTALEEICETFRWMGAMATNAIPRLQDLSEDEFISKKIKAAIIKAIEIISHERVKNQRSCCSYSPLVRIKGGGWKKLPHPVEKLIIEDHSGKTYTYKEFFGGKPSIVAFFYTRCDNPNKCSLTITRLGHLQKRMSAEGLDTQIKVAAITYDPFYDNDSRIKAYCENRGVTFSAEHRAFRVESGMPVLLKYFNSGVNYIGSIVNQHSTELYILDRDGNIRGCFQQLQWQHDEVIALLKKNLNRRIYSHNKFLIEVKNKTRNLASPLLALLILVSPKCPLCWAAYLSMLGITNIQFMHWTYELMPVFVPLMFVNLFSLYKGASSRNGLLPFVISLSGIISIIFFILLNNIKVFGYVGVTLSVAGAILNSLHHQNFLWVSAGVTRWVGQFKFNIHSVR